MTEVTMRVEEGAARARGAEREGRFAEALARARGPAREAGRGARGEGRAAEARGARAAPDVRSPSRPRGASARARSSGEEPRAALALAAARPREPAVSEPPVEVAPIAELARVARVLPVAVAALGPVGGPLVLSFGRSLDVELRATAAGVEVVLRPEPGLARAAEAELPRVVAALRVRGVNVARAEIRPRDRDAARPR